MSLTGRRENETIRDYNAGYYEEAAIAAAREPEPVHCDVCGKHFNDPINKADPCPACTRGCLCKPGAPSDVCYAGGFHYGRDPVTSAKMEANFTKLHKADPKQFPKRGCNCGCPSEK